MRILGVDPGSHATGYGVIDSEGPTVQLLEAGVVRTKAGEELPQRIQKIYGHLIDIIAQYQPQVLVLEKLYTHGSYVTTASILGHVRGVICLACAQKGIRLEESSVKRIRKALTGNGAATKQQTRAMVAKFLSIDETKLTLDASDALALALGYIHLNRKRI